jgi:uncharacterized protein YkwD
MEGRTLRREADSPTQLQTGHLARSRTSNRRVPKPAIRRIAVGVLALALALVAPPVIGVGVAPAHAAGCKYSHRGPQAMSRKDARHAVVCLMNKMRRHHGRHPLHARGSLNESGARHSRYMRRKGCFSHQCSGERDLVGRVKETGYLPCGCTWGVGENIAKGQGGRATPAAIVTAWMHSPPHRSEILSRRLHDVGVGVIWGNRGNRHAKVGTYTADFGYRRR